MDKKHVVIALAAGAGAGILLGIIVGMAMSARMSRDYTKISRG